MKNINRIGFALLILITFYACKEDPILLPAPEKVDINCINLTDANGASIGVYGTCSTSKHWAQIDLTAAQGALFDFEDAIDMGDTEDVVLTSFPAYPNPPSVGENIALQLMASNIGKKVRAKMTIVNDNQEIVRQYSVKLNGTAPVVLNMEEGIFEGGSFYRLYYRFSSKNTPILLEGYGNILVCKGNFMNDVERDCL